MEQCLSLGASSLACVSASGTCDFVDLRGRGSPAQPQLQVLPLDSNCTELVGYSPARLRWICSRLCFRLGFRRPRRELLGLRPPTIHCSTPLSPRRQLLSSPKRLSQPRSYRQLNIANIFHFATIFHVATIFFTSMPSARQRLFCITSVTYKADVYHLQGGDNRGFDEDHAGLRCKGCNGGHWCRASLFCVGPQPEAL